MVTSRDIALMDSVISTSSIGSVEIIEINIISAEIRKKQRLAFAIRFVIYAVIVGTFSILIEENKIEWNNVIDQKY